MGGRVHGDGRAKGRTYLNVKKIFDIERDGTAMHGRVIVCCAIEADICPNGKRNWLVLEEIERRRYVTSTTMLLTVTNRDRNSL